MTAEGFLAANLECVHRSAARAGLSTRDHVIAGLHIRLQVVGGQLATGLFEGLAPQLAVPSRESEPDLALYAFDTASGGETPPPPPWSPADYLPRDEIRGYAQGRWRAGYSLTRPTLWYHDTESGVGITWLRDGRSLNSWERARPWRTPLHFALPPRGRLLVHAGAVGGVLLAGPSTAGKSTTAVAGAAGGLHCVGDDYLVLAEDDGAWSAHAVYRWVKLDPLSPVLANVRNSFPLFPPDDDDDKVRLELAGSVASFPVRAVVVPRVAPRTGHPRPLQAAAALRAIVPSTLMQAPGRDPALAAALGRLVSAVPTAILDVGPDVEAIPDALREAASLAVAA